MLEKFYFSRFTLCSICCWNVSFTDILKNYGDEEYDYNDVVYNSPNIPYDGEKHHVINEEIKDEFRGYDDSNDEIKDARNGGERDEEEIYHRK